MNELMLDLYASGTQMSLVPFDDAMLVKFYHNESRASSSHVITSFDLGNSPVSMEKYIQLLFDNFLKEIGIKTHA